MKMILKNHWMLSVVSILAITSANPRSTPAAPLPDRAPPADHIDAATVEKLGKAWQDDGSPRTQVIVFADDNPAIKVDTKDLEMALNAAVFSQIRRGIGEIVDVDSAQLRTQGDLTALADKGGDELGRAIQHMTGSPQVAELIIQVRIRPLSDGTATVTLKAFDTRFGQELARKPFIPIKVNADILSINQYAASIVDNFADQYAQPRDRTIQLTLVGVESSHQALQIGGALAQLPGVKGRIKNSYTEGETSSLAQFSISYGTSNIEQLRSDIEDKFKGNKDIGLVYHPVKAEGGSIAAFVSKDFVPEWYKCTDLNDPKKTEREQHWREALHVTRSPKVAVVIGNDVNVPMMQIAEADKQAGAEKNFNDQTLSLEMMKSCHPAGLETIAQGVADDAMNQARKKANRFDNFPHLIEAMGDKKQFELLMYVTKQPRAEGTGYNAQLVRVDNGAVIASQTWPDFQHTLYNLSGTPVNPKDVGMVGRYIVGSLLNEGDQYLASDKRRVMEVVIKNVDKMDSVAAIAAVFAHAQNDKNGDLKVLNVENINYSVPVGGFEVVYEGIRDDLVNVITQRLPVINCPVTVEEFGETQIVLNLHHVVAPQITPQKLKQATDRIQGPEGQSMKKRIGDAQASVGVVGFLFESGKFVPIGTAWVVDQNHLATNAHVAKDIRDQLDELKGAKVWAVARMGAGLNPELKLGMTHIHPGYEAWTEFVKSKNRQDVAALIPPFDVALIDLHSPTNLTPLILASATELSAIRAGDTVGYTGFPMENVAGMEGQPGMKLDVGAICAFTNEFGGVGIGEKQILTHNLTTTGGASGSPLFNEDGHVIALNSAGDYVGQKVTVPVGRFARIVFTLDKSEPCFDEATGNIAIALLDQDGQPVRVSADHYQVRTSNGERPLNNNEQILHLRLDDLFIDPTTHLIVAINQEGARIPVGFKYGQNVAMLQELRDNTANANLAEHEKEWESAYSMAAK